MEGYKRGKVGAGGDGHLQTHGAVRRILPEATGTCGPRRRLRMEVYKRGKVGAEGGGDLQSHGAVRRILPMN